MRRFLVALLAAIAVSAPAPRPATLIPWAWERRETLHFLGDRPRVAFYAGLITLRGGRVLVEPRRNPLFVSPNAYRIAVVRIETDSPTLDEAQLRATVDRIRWLLGDAPELQLDFDAVRGERMFYRRLLFALRREIDAPLTITALASWCMDDRWLSDLPIDDAVPMLFRMGRDGDAIRARLRRGEDFAEPRCRTSLGISLDEPLRGLPRGRRVWIFNPRPWTEESWKRAERDWSR